jgi:hypothetical protein
MQEHILLRLRASVISLIILGMIGLTASLLKMQDFIAHERYVDTRETKILLLANEFVETLNSLAWSIREYAITMEPRYIQDYWHILEVEQKREHAMKGLHGLDIPKEEMRLLDLAQENANALVETEVRAMKLILLVFGVPVETMHPTIREYKLTGADIALSNKGKLNKAKEILFDDAYNESRNHALKPLSDFQKHMHERTLIEEARSYRKTNYALYFALSIGGFTLLAMLLLVIIGRFLYAVRTKNSDNK